MQDVFVPRLQEGQIKEKIKTSKIIVLNGTRNVGKRSLLERTFNSLGRSFVTINCLDKKERLTFIDQNESIEKRSIVLYEAQYLSDLNQVIENALDTTSWHTLVICTSYPASIHPELLEALRLEGVVFTLYPPTFYETSSFYGLQNEVESVEHRLVYGNYPEVHKNLDDAENILLDLVEKVIFTRLNHNDRINKKDELISLLKLLSFEIGNNISFNDIGKRCGIDNETVERYIYLLQDMNLIFVVKSFNHGHRYELKKGCCVYFVDNGIRNALIRNLNPFSFRNDIEALWKNHVISERIKWLRMSGVDRKLSFWLTHTHQRVDLIEESESGSKAYIMQFDKKKKAKIPPSFLKLYPTFKVSTVNLNTYWNFLTNKR